MRNRSFLAVAVLLAFVAAACGASGGDDSAAPTVTRAQIEALMPTADDVGPNYEQSDEDDDEDEESTSTTAAEDDPTEDAFLEACPAAAKLDFEDSSDNPDEVAATFEAEDGREVEVSLDPTPPDFTKDKVDELVNAFNDCGTVEVEDDEGNPIEFTLSAEREDDFGDFGMRVTMNGKFEIFGAPTEIQLEGLFFSTDGIGVAITATSGLGGDDTFSMDFVPADVDLLADLAELMEERIATLDD